MWGNIYVGLDDLKLKCDTPESRRIFLESMILDGRKIPWRDCELAFAFSLKDDDRDWCFGLFDPTLAKLLQGKFESGDDKGAEDFAQELSDSLSVSASEFDDVTTSLMIARIRESAEDDLYNQGLLEDDSFVFGDGASNVSATADKKRREALFKALCALRFVRLGLKIQ